MPKRSRKKAQPRAAAPSIARSENPLHHERLIVAGVLVALAIAVFAIYGQCASHELTHLDDADYVTGNAHVTSGLSASGIRWAFTSVHGANWIPLVWISYMLDVQISGLDAGRILLTNVALHALNAALLFLWLRRMTGAMWRSAVVAALFAVHPLHVESVAWASERKDVLSTVFFLATCWFYTEWVRERGSIRYAAAVVALAAGLMSKPMLVTTPFVLLLLDWWPLRRTISPRLLLEKIPMFVLAIVASAITVGAQSRGIAAVPLSLRISNALNAYLSYLAKTIWPSRLAVIYPYQPLNAGWLVAAAVILLGITGATIAVRRKYPFALIGWLWFAGTLVPVIGLVQVGPQSMADRYMYIPHIGLFVGVVWTLAAVLPRPVQAGLAAVALAAFTVLAFVQVGYWRNGVVLLEHCLAETSDNPYAHGVLGTELMSVGNYTRAADELRIAVRAWPRETRFRASLANALSATGDRIGAEREAGAALAIDPDDTTALGVRANIAYGDGRIPDAIRDYEHILRLRHDPRASASLAAIRGNDQEAAAAYAAAIRVNPSDPALHNDLGALLARAGRDAEALAEYESALRINPDLYDANMNSGALLSRMDRNAEAVARFAAAAKARPESPEPHVYLALVHAQLRQSAEAAAEAHIALAKDEGAANRLFTNAIRIPMKESNLRDWIASLEAGRG